MISCPLGHSLSSPSSSTDAAAATMKEEDREDEGREREVSFVCLDEDRWEEGVGGGEGRGAVLREEEANMKCSQVSSRRNCKF